MFLWLYDFDHTAAGGVITGGMGKAASTSSDALCAACPPGQALPLEGKPFGRGDGGFKAAKRGNYPIGK